MPVIEPLTKFNKYTLREEFCLVIVQENIEVKFLVFFQLSKTIVSLQTKIICRKHEPNY